MNKKIAEVVRVISIPPIVISIFIIILLLTKTVLPLDGLLLFIFLGLIQLAAYPLSYIIKPIKKRGREGQRDLAFLLGLVGYSSGLIYALVANVNHNLKVLYLTYFISIIILSFINKVLKIRASGHLCSITGPLVGLAYFIGPLTIIPSLIFYVLVFWSSLLLKRHTKREMVLGTLTTIGSFGITLLLFLIFKV